MGEACSAGGDAIETQHLVRPVGMRDAHRRAARSVRVSDHALVRDVEMLATPVEQLPQRARMGMRLGLCVARVFAELRHRRPECPGYPMPGPHCKYRTRVLYIE